jgi:citrate synthase
VGLAGHATLEEAAALLWERTPAPVFAPALPPGDAGHSPRERAFLALSRAAAASLPCLGRTRPVLQLEAAGLVGILAASFGAAEGARPLHELLAQGWGCAPATAELLRQALVLLADQELTTSAFAARVTASTGASLAAAALSGLAALTGPLHGDATTQVRLLFEDVSACGVERAVGRHLASGLPVPGFGHRLYPDGDPRAAALLAAFDPPEEVLATIATVATMTGQRPTIDVALAALARRFALPPDAPFSLFALGRSVGWLAHAMEQSLGGELIRPRARYSGPPVEWPLPDDDKRKSASTSFS